MTAASAAISGDSDDRSVCPCGADSTVLRENGPHIEGQCATCGRHLRFVAKADLGMPRRSVRSRPDLKPSTRAKVIARANRACELCHAKDKPLHVAHIVSRDDAKAQGWTEQEMDHLENLLATCEECNLGMATEPIPVRIVLGAIRARLEHNRPRLPPQQDLPLDEGRPF